MAFVALILACAQSKKPAANSVSLAPPTFEATAPADFSGIHNVVAYGENLYSGSAPEGDSAFDTLKEMGITTVISVDGAEPNVAAAKARGLRYIHLPIGYNGMNHERTLQIAKAIQTADGSVYVHCHHGKHRSAGAAGAAAVTLGLLDHTQAQQRMKVSGTSPSYTGLYRCVAMANPASRKELKAVSSDFPEVWKSSGLVQAMVEIEHALDRLLKIEKAGWKTPADHPDLVPVAEAGQLADLYRNLQDDPKVKTYPKEFTESLLKSSHETEILEEALSTSNENPEKMSATLKAISQSCKECHVKYRD